MFAQLSGNPETVALLTSVASNINTPNDKSINSLHIAIKRHEKEQAAILIAKGANVNASDNTGFTPLMLACQEGDAATAKLLLEYGAMINATYNSNGRSITPLMIAAMKGHESVVRLLMNNNVDTTIKDGQGCNAAVYARHNGFEYIARIIEGRD